MMQRCSSPMLLLDRLARRAAPRSLAQSTVAAFHTLGTRPASDDSTPGQRRSDGHHSSANDTVATTHFGFKDVRVEDKAKLVGQVFHNVANTYDLMNDAMSGGLHRVWKDLFIQRMFPFPGTRLLDVAGGTGDIAFRFIDHINRMHASGRLLPTPAPSPKSSVLVCDINPSMLGVGKQRAEALGKVSNETMDVNWVVGDAENLPVASNSVDVYSIAFGIRNVTNIDKAIREACRVLVPGGRFMCLEFSQVHPAVSGIYDAYSFEVIPALGDIIASDRASYQYLVESIRKFPIQTEFAKMISSAGFRSVSFHNLTLGVAAIHSGFKLLFAATGVKAGNQDTPVFSALWDMTDYSAEFSGLSASFKKIETSFESFKAASKSMFSAQDECVKAISAQKKNLGDLQDALKRKSPTVSEQQQLEMEMAIQQQLQSLKRMEVAFPQKKTLLLRLVLGDVNMTLPKMGDRFKYKEDYENFKLKMTVITVVLAFLILTVLHYRFMEAVFNMLIVWFYCVATLREHILLANGSRIRTWWLWHHYLSIILSGVLLIWPDSFSYQAFRNQFLVFSIYVGVIQVLQFRYQTSRLYMLRALGKIDAMDVTTEVSSRGLSYLVPMLMFGHAFQFYNAYTLFNISNDPRCLEWQVFPMMVLFVVLGSGNFITLMRTLVHKATTHAAPATAAAATKLAPSGSKEASKAK